MPAGPTRLRDRVAGWLSFERPITYRDAWRFGLLAGCGAIAYAVTALLLGSAFWPVSAAVAAYVVLVVPFGFAVREKDRRHVALSGGALVAVTLALAAVSDAVTVVRELGPAAVLVGFVLLVFGVIGYSFPDVAPVDRNAPGNG